MQKNHPVSLTNINLQEKKKQNQNTETKARMKRKIKIRQKILDIIDTGTDQKIFFFYLPTQSKFSIT